MTERIAVEVVVQVGMSVDVHDGEVAMVLPERPQDGVRDGVIATDRDDLPAGGKLRAHRCGDRFGVDRRTAFVVDRHVTDVVEAWCHVHRGLVRVVPRRSSGVPPGSPPDPVHIRT